MWIKSGPTLSSFRVSKHKVKISKGENTKQQQLMKWSHELSKYEEKELFKTKCVIHNVAQLHALFGTKCKYIKVKIFCKRKRPLQTRAKPRIPYLTSINFPATNAAKKNKMRKGIIALIKQKQYQPTMLQK